MKKLYYMTALLVLFGALSAAVAQMGLTTQPGMMRSLVSTFSGSRDFPGGSSDYVTVADDASLQFGTGDFAVSFWVKPDSLVGHGFYKTDNFRAVFSGSTLIFRVGSSTNITITAGSTGVWSHYVVTRSSGTVKVYLNGSEEASTTQAGDVDYSGQDMRFGGASGSPAEFNGLAADFRIYNANLSPTEVTNLYTNKRASTVTSGLVLHLPLNDGPEYLTDQSGEGNDGTTAGTLTSSALEP